MYVCTVLKFINLIFLMQTDTSVKCTVDRRVKEHADLLSSKT